MPFSEENKYAIKCLRQNKNYSARRFLKEFPNKGWTLGGLNVLIRKIDGTGNIERRPGSGRKRSARTDARIDFVFAPVLKLLAVTLNINYDL